MKLREIRRRRGVGGGTSGRNVRVRYNSAGFTGRVVYIYIYIGDAKERRRSTPPSSSKKSNRPSSSDGRRQQLPGSGAADGRPEIGVVNGTSGGAPPIFTVTHTHTSSSLITARNYFALFHSRVYTPHPVNTTVVTEWGLQQPSVTDDFTNCTGDNFIAIARLSPKMFVDEILPVLVYASPLRHCAFVFHRRDEFLKRSTHDSLQRVTLQFRPK